MKILVIEDEPLVARDLIALIGKLEPMAETFGPLSSVASSTDWFAKNSLPDLILSDIQLSDGISFEIFENMHLRCPVIFTTAYDAYAIRAFKLNSIDYLLKPIDATELANALRKYKSIAVDASLHEQFRYVLSQWGVDHKRFKERFLAMHRNTLVPVKSEEIAFFHKEELIYIHTISQEKMIGEHATLDEIEGLINPDHFFRVNRQYLIHSQTVSRIRSTQKGLSVQLKAPFNLELDISREKAVAFKKWLEG